MWPFSRRATSLGFVAGGGDDAADGAQLVARLLSGEAEALALIYRRESAPVYRYALAVCGQADWAADAMQDAFVAFATRPQGWQAERGSLGAYLAGMARHALLARWREAGRHVEQEAAEPDGEGVEPNQAQSPEALLVRRQAQSEVWAAVQALPWPFREALVLVDLQERSYAEAAAIAGVELNTLRTRVHRARQRLAERLSAGVLT